MDTIAIWPGWLGGVAVGVFMLAMIVLTGKALGVSSAYGDACGVAFGSSHYQTDKYGKAHAWRLMFALGLPVGGALAVLTSGASWHPTTDMGPLYEQVLPQALWARGLVLAAGGVLIGYGARAAGGCQSGHAIMGMSLLNPPSVVSGAGFFVGGIVAVQLLFRVIA